ncbi:MAG: hypothetical protein FWB91_11320 [Defluviitaleaceae bacterium]|nr:hypothetical protein [Defluviitaleaceae bacterium]
MGQTISKSGVKLYDDFRDNLIISKYDNQFVNMRSEKLEKIKSSNSEDALTWNYFKSLREINPNDWLPQLFFLVFKNEFKYPLDNIVINLWQEILPPPSLLEKQKEEGKSEIDAIIESEDFVWLIEAKYKSDISLRTTNNESRDQLIRNIDVGSFYAGEKDFYFSLLYHNDEFVAKGIEKIKEYSGKTLAGLKEMLNHRKESLENIKGICSFKWNDLLKLDLQINHAVENDIFDILKDYLENLDIRN